MAEDVPFSHSPNGGRCLFRGAPWRVVTDAVPSSVSFFPLSSSSTLASTSSQQLRSPAKILFLVSPYHAPSFSALVTANCSVPLLRSTVKPILSHIPSPVVPFLPFFLTGLIADNSSIVFCKVNLFRSTHLALPFNNWSRACAARSRLTSRCFTVDFASRPVPPRGSHSTTPVVFNSFHCNSSM